VDFEEEQPDDGMDSSQLTPAKPMALPGRWHLSPASSTPACRRPATMSARSKGQATLAGKSPTRCRHG
jgi:hypothetical protein